MKRLLLLVLGWALCDGLQAADVVAPDQAKIEGNLAWFDVRVLGLEGQGFKDVAAPFDRLPARAEKTVRPAVWSLSRQSAGLCVRFETDATELHARWKLTSPNLAMPHMPATGVSGLDLYVRDGSQWKWLANGRPSAQETTLKLTAGITAQSRQFLLYLPLYNGVERVELGLPKTAKLMLADPRQSGLKPIVFYGTSITQGGCASRPGMVHTALLGRWLDAPVINLGFSGNGKLEPEVTQYIAEIDASVFVLDCLPNIEAKDVTERTEPTVALLRKHHPQTPIVLVEDRDYSDSFLVSGKLQRNRASQAALKAAYEKLKAAGDSQLFYITGPDMLGADNEGTVDSSHPTDLGFFRQAEAFHKVLQPLLKKAQ